MESTQSKGSTTILCSNSCGAFDHASHTPQLVMGNYRIAGNIRWCKLSPVSPTEVICVVLTFAVANPSVKSGKICTMQNFPAIRYYMDVLSDLHTYVLTYTVPHMYVCSTTLCCLLKVPCMYVHPYIVLFYMYARSYSMYV